MLCEDIPCVAVTCPYVVLRDVTSKVFCWGRAVATQDAARHLAAAQAWAHGGPAASVRAPRCLGPEVQ
eukprot:2744289-Pyramimonas_sp.AAC.1